MKTEEKHHHHEVSGKNLGITILLNVIITVAEAVGGFISGSMSLLSDAAHNLSDVISLMLSYGANRLAKRKAGEKQTYGFKRSEILAAFINSATLVGLAIFIIVEATQRLFTHPTISVDWVIYLSLLSIVINGLSALFIKKDAEKNMNMKSAYLHLFTDMLTSVAVLIGGLAMKYLQWFWVDSVFSIAIAIYLLYMSWEILKSSIKILMQFTPDDIDLLEVVSHLEKIEGIKNVHHVHLWQINEHEFMFEAHVDMVKDSTISEFEKMLGQIKTELLSFEITHFTIQPEFEMNDNKQVIHH